MLKTWFYVTGLTLGLMLAACGQSANEPAAGSGEAGSAASAGDTNPNDLTIQGSDTMNVMVAAWAEAFMAENPEARIAVTGGGSGTGIAALKNGTTDLCMASRPIRESEVRSIVESTGQEPVEHTVAMDGIAVVVNPGNPVDVLTLAQLEAIFTGEIENWSAVGGPDEEIVIFSRDSSSGTFVFFQSHVLNRKDYAPTARLLPSNAAIVSQVNQTDGAIGYVGLGYVEPGLKVIKVKDDEQAEPVEPSIETIRSGDYAIARGLFLYTMGEGSPLARRFIEFCLSPPGQAIVMDLGEVPVR